MEAVSSAPFVPRPTDGLSSEGVPWGERCSGGAASAESCGGWTLLVCFGEPILGRGRKKAALLSRITLHNQYLSLFPHMGTTLTRPWVGRRPGWPEPGPAQLHLQGNDCGLPLPLPHLLLSPLPPMNSQHWLSPPSAITRPGKTVQWAGQGRPASWREGGRASVPTTCHPHPDGVGAPRSVLQGPAALLSWLCPLGGPAACLPFWQQLCWDIIHVPLIHLLKRWTSQCFLT